MLEILSSAIPNESGNPDAEGVMLHPATACRAGSVAASTKTWIRTTQAQNDDQL